MEKIVFKNMYVNIVLGGVLVIASLLGYFMGWFEDFLPIVVASLLILLSTKRFVYSYKRIVSKNATLILFIEFVLDLVFGGLLIYLNDHIDIFMGLIIYIRGVSYLLINYIATRKIKLLQYIFNIFYVTIGCFLMFGPWDSQLVLVIGISALILIIGAVYLQAGLTNLVAKEEAEEKKEKEQKQELKELEQKYKEQMKVQKEVDKNQDKIEKLEEKVKSVEVEHQKTLEETKQLQKQLEQAQTKPEVRPEPRVETTPKPKPQPLPVALESKTVLELRVIAKDKNIAGYSQLNKADLIKKIKAAK